MGSKKRAYESRLLIGIHGRSSSDFLAKTFVHALSLETQGTSAFLVALLHAEGQTDRGRKERSLGANTPAGHSEETRDT